MGAPCEQRGFAVQRQGDGRTKSATCGPCGNKEMGPADTAGGKEVTLACDQERDRVLR